MNAWPAPWLDVHPEDNPAPVRLFFDHILCASASDARLEVVDRGGQKTVLQLVTALDASRAAAQVMEVIEEREAVLTQSPSLGTLGRHLELVSQRTGSSEQHLLAVALSAIAQAGANTLELKVREASYSLRVERLGILHEAGTVSLQLGKRLASACGATPDRPRGDVIIEGRIGGPTLHAEFLCDGDDRQLSELTIKLVSDGIYYTDLNSLGLTNTAAEALRRALTQPGHFTVLAGGPGSMMDETVMCALREWKVAWGIKASLLTLTQRPGRRSALSHDEVISPAAVASRIRMATEDGIKGLYVTPLDTPDDFTAVAQALEAGLAVFTTIEARGLLDLTTWASRRLPGSLSTCTTLALLQSQAVDCPHCGAKGCGRCHGSGITGHRLGAQLLAGHQLAPQQTEAASDGSPVGRPLRHTGP